MELHRGADVMKGRADVQDLPTVFFQFVKSGATDVEVPFRSISTTVPKPFGESSSAAHRKFPAAPLTTMSSFPNRATDTAIAFSIYSGLRTSAATAKASPIVDRSAGVAARTSRVARSSELPSLTV